MLFDEKGKYRGTHRILTCARPIGRSNGVDSELTTIRCKNPAIRLLAAATPAGNAADAMPRAETHYSPSENLEWIDAQQIAAAQLSIDTAAYVLSDARVIETLTHAAKRDVVIRLYLDRSQFEQHDLRQRGPLETLWLTRISAPKSRTRAHSRT